MLWLQRRESVRRQRGIVLDLVHRDARQRGVRRVGRAHAICMILGGVHRGVEGAARPDDVELVVEGRKGSKAQISLLDGGAPLD